MLSRKDSLSPASDLPLRGYLAFIALVFLAILIRLLYLQVVTGVELKISSLGNIIQDFATPAPRGDIYDRSGKPLAKNKQVFKLLYIRPPDLEDYLLDPKESKELERLRNPEDKLSSADVDLRIRLEYQSRFLNGSGLEKERLKNGDPLVELMDLSGYFSGLKSQQDEDEDEDEGDAQVKPKRVYSPAELKVYEELMKRVSKEVRRVFGNQPITLADSVTYPQVVFIEEHREKYPRLLIDEYAFQRFYPLKEAAAHLLGYTGSMGPSENNALKSLGYPQNEVVGKDGAERAYEEMLHGTPGIRYIRLNRSGLGVDFLRESSTDKNSAQYQIAPLKGSDVYLTIDAGLQATAFQRLSMEGLPGAVIVNSLAEGHEGEILAMTSAPGFDPLRLKEDDYYQRLLSDPGKPFINRDFGLAFPIGSTFKIVTTAAAIQTGRFTLNNGFYCPGFKDVGNLKFNCHNRSGHQGVNLLMGFAKSCDVVYYNVGLGLENTPDTLKQYGEYFGYGSKLGIDLPGEAAGLLPDEAVKREKRMAAGERKENELVWYEGDSANYAIGQGFLTATPLQVLWSASTVAWNGERYDPKLLYGKQADNRMISVTPNRPKRTPLEKETLNALRQCMLAAASPDGTCKKLGSLGLEVGAKSGTAETSGGKEDHSWVVGYYPVSNPKYGFVVFVQNGGHGTDAAIPVAYDLLKYIHKHPIIANRTPAAEANRLSGK